MIIDDPDDKKSKCMNFEQVEYLLNSKQSEFSFGKGEPSFYHFKLLYGNFFSEANGNWKG